MHLVSLRIQNLKFIHDMEISNIGNALILVGKNSSGKSSILNAIRALGGGYAFTQEDFNEKKQNIEITVSLAIEKADLHLLHQNGVISRYRRFEAWEKVFCNKLPSYENGVITFQYIVNRDGKIRYYDGIHKHNKYIQTVFPQIYFMDTHQDLLKLQDEILMFQEEEVLKQMRSGCCIFNQARKCIHCFQCIGLIQKKSASELNAFETYKLLEYKLYQLNLGAFSEKVSYYFRKNGGFAGKIRYEVECDADSIFQVKGKLYDDKRKGSSDMSMLGKGMHSIYMLSLLEAYVEGDNRIPSLIMMEEPETFQHPGLQKASSEILYRLSKKNQVIFTTHSPNLLYNFNSRQIRQVYRDKEYYSNIRTDTDIDVILDELGHSANDLLNVNFVFIVEGKQDKSRLPLLLEKYYGEIQREDGQLRRIAIITTNSCTNIKTYANLKYMNKIYLKDQFLMIRDGDGKNQEELAGQLCRYYEERNHEDADKLPRVTRKNVLVLKYYSFENYFLNPKIMVQIGILKKEEDFYKILFQKWKEYLHRIRSGRQLTEVIGVNINSVKDLKAHMEEFKIHMRGHNLFDIFYGSYRDREQDLLRQYIDLAKREDFQDILDSIDRFSYFDNRKK